MSTKSYLTFTLLSLVTIILGVVIGSHYIPVNEIFEETYLAITFEYRLPRTLASFILGATLSMCGVAFQALFKNPLTSPYTLGVASSASLGAVIAITMGVNFSIFGLSSIAVFAMISSLISIWILIYILKSFSILDTSKILLVGIALNLFCSSLTIFFQYLANERDAKQITRWLVGSTDVVGFESIYTLAPFFTFAAIFFLRNRHKFNMLLLNDHVAQTRGLDVLALRKRTIVYTSIIIAGMTSECGPVSFVGIIIPHLTRSFVGQNLRVVLPASLFIGGIFLSLCDIVSRILLQSYSLHVGIITALIGGPFFIYALVKNTQS